MHEHALIEKDLSLFYRITGEGEPIVLIHGFGEDSTIWDGMIAELSNTCKLIVPDLAGSGRSKGNMDGISMENLAEHINLILEKESVDLCYMIGHSMGGYITLAFAEKYRHKLNGLGLFHSTVFPDNEEKKSVRSKNIEFIKNYGSEKFIAQSVPNLFSEYTKNERPQLVKEIITRYSQFSPTSLVAYTAAMKDRPDRSDVLRNFKKPVLLIMGEYDTAIPIEQSLKMCEIADFAYIYIAAQSGHMGMLEEPEFCLKAITDFLSGR
ncbi:MAG TPA: alpha/beta hydrolase [Flavitalea sp.]|nr:alpha/beta hydrolase [Flavitalea sp.]